MLNKGSSNSPQNSPQQVLITEVGKLIEIRNACLAARANAHIASVETDSSDSYIEYALAKERCINLAESISDGFYRDSAYQLIYDLCKRASDQNSAENVLSRIETGMIRGNITDGRPPIFD